MGRHIFLRDLVAAHGDIRQEDATRAVRGGAGGKAAVDLLNEISDALDGFSVGDVLLDDLKTRFFIVNESNFARLAGAERHGLLRIG